MRNNSLFGKGQRFEQRRYRRIRNGNKVEISLRNARWLITPLTRRDLGNLATSLGVAGKDLSHLDTALVERSCKALGHIAASDYDYTLHYCFDV